MRRHDILDEEARERAALYALTSLAPAEAITYEAHLAICEPCRQEVAALREATLGLALLSPEATPRADLREEILARFRKERAPSERATTARPSAPVKSTQIWQNWQNWSASTQRDGLFLARAGEGRWEETGAAGVEVRRLFVDRPNDRVTMLVRMAPGSSYPAHRHGDPEECYVLQGDLLVGGMRLHPGDYQRASTGSVHGVQETEGGCLLLIVSSMKDELLDG